MDRPNYFAWFIVVAIGVASGNLLSNYVTAQVVAYQVSKAAEEAAARAEAARTRAAKREADQQRARDEKAEQNRQAMRRIRARTKHGKRIVRECAEWQKSARENDSDYARSEAERACKKKEQFLDSGIWDPKLGD